MFFIVLLVYMDAPMVIVYQQKQAKVHSSSMKENHIFKLKTN